MHGAEKRYVIDVSSLLKIIVSYDDRPCIVRVQLQTYICWYNVEYAEVCISGEVSHSKEEISEYWPLGMKS